MASSAVLLIGCCRSMLVYCTYICSEYSIKHAVDSSCRASICRSVALGNHPVMMSIDMMPLLRREPPTQIPYITAAPPQKSPAHYHHLTCLTIRTTPYRKTIKQSSIASEKDSAGLCGPQLVTTRKSQLHGSSREKTAVLHVLSIMTTACTVVS